MMTRFVMPDNPEAKIHIHSDMLARVQDGIQQITSRKVGLETELILAESQGRDTTELTKIKRNLRLQELCLVDQEKRLKGRIECLRTGCSTGAEKADA